MINTKFGSDREVFEILCQQRLAIAARKASSGKIGGKAKALRTEELRKLLSYISRKRDFPEADVVKIFLSFMAGLRACEISGLTIADVTNADGTTADVIRIRPNATKGGKGREVPICAELKAAIDVFRAKYPHSDRLAVSHRYGRVKHQSANAVTVWFHWLYRKVGLKNCSSHSGRRTYITTLARNLPPQNSLRDVQRLAGHARLSTTETYIEVSPTVGAMVSSIGARLLGNLESAKA